MKQTNHAHSLPYTYYYIGLVILGLLVSLLGRCGLVNRYFQQIFMLVCINIIMTVSLNLINGFTGEFSIGHAAFMAIGAYTSCIVTTIVFSMDKMPLFFQVPAYLFAIIAGALAAFIFGYVIGLPILRLQGDYLAIVTLALVEIVRSTVKVTDEIAILLNTMHLRRLANIAQAIGGPRGMGKIPGSTNIFWVVLFAILVVFITRRLLYSSYGRVWLSLRDDQIAAEMMGVNVSKYKVLSFAISSFWAGLGGGLYAHVLRYIHPDNFNFIKSIEYLVYLYLGGMSSIWGSILGASLLTFLLEFLRVVNLQQWRMVIYPLLLIIFMLKKPEGILKKDI
ncbi:MAG: branched-chain amino acid ABC transporter permease [bacterium]